MCRHSLVAIHTSANKLLSSQQLSSVILCTRNLFYIGMNCYNNIFWRCPRAKGRRHLRCWRQCLLSSYRHAWASQREQTSIDQSFKCSRFTRSSFWIFIYFFTELSCESCIVNKWRFAYMQKRDQHFFYHKDIPQCTFIKATVNHFLHLKETCFTYT